MATKRASKNKASSKTKTTPQKQTGKQQAPAAAQLHKLIEQLIDAKQRGDYAAANTATTALADFHKRPAAAAVRQAAAEAQAVAGNAFMVDSLRQLRAIAAWLRPAA